MLQQLQNLTSDYIIHGYKTSGVAKPRHTRARARATFACALAFARRSFKVACFRTLTFRSTVYVALPVPEQLPDSRYATV